MRWQSSRRHSLTTPAHGAPQHWQSSCAVSYAKTNRSPNRMPSSRWICGARSTSKFALDAAISDIVDFMVARYGDFVLYRPPVKPHTWLLWFGPALLAIAALIAFMRALRNRRRRTVERPLTETEHAEAERLLGSPQMHRDDFVIIAVAMVTVALAWMLWPLLRPTRRTLGRTCGGQRDDLQGSVRRSRRRSRARHVVRRATRRVQERTRAAAAG